MTMASVLYHLAMRDEMLPRFPAPRCRRCRPAAVAAAAPTNARGDAPAAADLG